MSIAEKFLNALTLSFVDQNVEPCHTATYIFLSSQPVALMPDASIVLEFLKPYIEKYFVGSLNEYEFHIVCNILDENALPDLNMPFVDVNALRNKSNN